MKHTKKKKTTGICALHGVGVEYSDHSIRC